MLRSLLKLTFAASVALVLAGCTFEGEMNAVAQCLVERATPTEVAQYGMQVGRDGEVHLKRWDVVGCDGGWELAFDADARQEVAQLLPPLLVTENSFRRGAYASLLQPGATSKERGAFADLGLKIEEYANRREEALNCLGAQKGVLEIMAETDLPFAIAVTGIHAGVSDPVQARLLAAELIDRAQMAATLTQRQSCEGEKDTEFRRYAAELQQFMEGTHPWAPGCKTSVDGTGVTLRCDGVASVEVPAAPAVEPAASSILP